MTIRADDMDEERPAAEVSEPARSGFGGSRGQVDYMLRTAQQNMMHLSAMADQKASFVLAAGLVMATIVFGDVAGDTELDAVRVVLLATALISGGFAAWALSPRLWTQPSRPQPLFFGSIAQLDRDEYRSLMSELILDDERIYQTIFDDLHASSTVLVRSKFRPLQASYAVLVIGMLSTFVVALAT